MPNQFVSTCPATGAVLWKGRTADEAEAVMAVRRARRAFEVWALVPIEERIAIVERYRDVLRADSDHLAVAIARETGKPRWEALQEVAAMVGKVDISIRAQAERAGTRLQPTDFGEAVLRHQPHGVMVVFGPYNFPGHLPNGHIVPALLAGNAVVFKPSEETPLTGELIGNAWARAGLPDDVLIVLQGGRETGAALVSTDIDGLLFTGSAATGDHLRRALVDRPGIILALELGGNNPLIAWDGELDAVASIVVTSAFATTGQRCSCARRLIVRDNREGERIVAATAALADRMIVGAWDDEPEPACGPLISASAAQRARSAVDALIDAGATVIRPFDGVAGRSPAFVKPAMLDVTGITVPDDEIFAPVLQVIRVPDFDSAVRAANATRFGLAAGLISADASLWRRYATLARAGVVNWNRPTTGASGSMPFGGLGASGNHRPSAYYAADYCAFPVASFESARIANLSADMRGLQPG